MHYLYTYRHKWVSLQRERETETDRQRQTETQTERQTDRETETETGREWERASNRQIERDRNTERLRGTDRHGQQRETDQRQRNRQIGREKERYRYKQRAREREEGEDILRERESDGKTLLRFSPLNWSCWFVRLQRQGKAATKSVTSSDNDAGLIASPGNWLETFVFF